MPWDAIWFFLRTQAPTFEVIGTFVALAAAILLMPRVAGIKWSFRVAARDLALLTFFAVLSLVLIGLEPQRHWMQRLADWLQSLF